jgi:hypothetical protein
MSSKRAITVFLCVMALSFAATGSAQEIGDPYEVLNRYFQAEGGLERLRAERSSYSEGTLSMGGMEGSLNVWMQKPGKSRAEIALGPLNIIQGDNGQHAWVLDQNGKLQVITNPDEATIKRRRVARLMEEYAFADRESDVFTVSLDSIEQLDSSNCYVITVTNNINVDRYKVYINTQTFAREKEVFIEDVQSRDAYHKDLREIEGLLVPFWTKEIYHQTGQDQEIRLTEYVSNPKIDPVQFEPPEQGAKDYEFVDGDRAENIKFGFIGNHLYIPVTVGGKKRHWVLDTGAGISVLNRAFSEELGLELEGQVKGQGAGGTVSASFTTLPPYHVEGIQFQEQTIAVIDMNELIRRLGVDVVGILGFDFLSRFVTKVDFANETVSFYDPETFTYTGGGQVLDIHIDNSVFAVHATLDGNHSGTWLFDLGAGTTHLDGIYALREGYADKKGVLGMGHGAGNEYQLKKVRCDSLHFAGFTVYGPEVNFSYGGTDTVFTADRIGVLGNSLFRNFVLYCDYANERLIVEEGDKFNQPWPTDNSGLQIAWSADHKVEVSYVSPGTPVNKAGFLKGDLLKKIGSIDVTLTDDIIAIRELLKADPGTEYNVVIDRGGEEKILKLTLAKLL